MSFQSRTFVFILIVIKDASVIFPCLSFLNKVSNFKLNSIDINLKYSLRVLCDIEDFKTLQNILFFFINEDNWIHLYIIRMKNLQQNQEIATQFLIF